MITVLRTGVAASVQDLGRSGQMRLGIGRSGAMDPFALRLGNSMLRNVEGAAAIETALAPLSVRFEQARAFAVTGALVNLRLGDRRLPSGFATRADAGEVLTLEPSREGVFAYLCLEGGVNTPELLGSRSTDLKSGYGGLDGRALAAGDRLACGGEGGAAGLPPHGLGIAPRALQRDGAGAVAELRFVRAAEWAAFGVEAQARFTAETWTVSREANRQGYRLDGPALRPAEPLPELFSHGVIPGVIQVPPNGRPIVQMVEANTCGGYPKLGVVVEADLPRLAQRRAGEALRFRAVDPAEALAARAASEGRLLRLAGALDLMRGQGA